MNLEQNVVVLGVGHSGTSVVTKMISVLGWHLNDADDQFVESAGLTGINRRLIAGDDVDVRGMVDVLRGFESPYVVKDPRLVVTLDSWTPAFSTLGSLPVVLYVTRARGPLEKSYLERGEVVGGVAGAYGLKLDELLHQATRQIDTWPGPKVQCSYEDLQRAVSMFRLSRRMTPEGGLWHAGTPSLRLKELRERLRVIVRKA